MQRGVSLVFQEDFCPEMAFLHVKLTDFAKWLFTQRIELVQKLLAYVFWSG